MRIDKYLKNARLIKRRTVAKEACDGGRVLLNGRQAKAGSEVKEGDCIRISFGSGSLDLRVKATPDAVRKEEADSLYDLINTEGEFQTPSPENKKK